MNPMQAFGMWGITKKSLAKQKRKNKRKNKR